MTETTHLTERDEVLQKTVALRIRYRIRFQKIGLLRWTSHRDLARLWERIVRRARLKPSMTEGFHPKPRIGFPSALALGVEGLDEVVELDLAEEILALDLLKRLNDDNQPGLVIKSVARLPEGFGKAKLERSDYTISIPQSADRNAIQPAIDTLLRLDEVTIERKKKKPVVANIATQIPVLQLGDDCLELSLAASESASLKPSDVLDLLGFGDWIENGALIARTRVKLSREFQSENTTEMALSRSV